MTFPAGRFNSAMYDNISQHIPLHKSTPPISGGVITKTYNTVRQTDNYAACWFLLENK
jgi:hypothetical protein